MNIEHKNPAPPIQRGFTTLSEAFADFSHSLLTGQAPIAVNQSVNGQFGNLTDKKPVQKSTIQDLAAGLADLCNEKNSGGKYDMSLQKKLATLQVRNRLLLSNF